MNFNALGVALFIWSAMAAALTFVVIPYFWRRHASRSNPIPPPTTPPSPSPPAAQVPPTPASPDSEGRCRCVRPRVITAGKNVLEWRCEICGGLAVYDRKSDG